MKNKNLLAVLVVMTIFSMSFTMACSCIAPKSVEDELNNSAAVFQGKVVSINSPLMDRYTHEITFDVERSWKGTTGKEITVETALDSAACGYPFEENKTYVVYAMENEGKLTASLCSRTVDLEYAEEDLAELGDGTAPQEDGVKEKPLFQKIREWIAKLFS